METQTEKREYEFIVKSNMKDPKNIRFNQKIQCNIEADSYSEAEAVLINKFTYLPKIVKAKLIKTDKDGIKNELILKG
jgi:hypothetical protein